MWARISLDGFQGNPHGHGGSMEQESGFLRDLIDGYRAGVASGAIPPELHGFLRVTYYINVVST